MFRVPPQWRTREAGSLRREDHTGERRRSLQPEQADRITKVVVNTGWGKGLVSAVFATFSCNSFPAENLIVG